MASPPVTPYLSQSKKRKSAFVTPFKPPSMINKHIMESSSKDEIHLTPVGRQAPDMSQISTPGLDAQTFFDIQNIIDLNQQTEDSQGTDASSNNTTRNDDAKLTDSRTIRRYYNKTSIDQGNKVSLKNQVLGAETESHELKAQRQDMKAISPSAFQKKLQKRKNSNMTKPSRNPALDVGKNYEKKKSNKSPGKIMKVLIDNQEENNDNTATVYSQESLFSVSNCSLPKVKPIQSVLNSPLPSKRKLKSKSPCYTPVQSPNTSTKASGDVFQMTYSPPSGVNRKLNKKLKKAAIKKKVLRVIMKTKIELKELHKRRAAIWSLECDADRTSCENEV